MSTRTCTNLTFTSETGRLIIPDLLGNNKYTESSAIPATQAEATGMLEPMENQPESDDTSTQAAWVWGKKRKSNSKFMLDSLTVESPCQPWRK